MFGFVARSAVTVGIAGSLVFAMPTAQAAMPNPGPILTLVPAAAGTLTLVGAAAVTVLPSAAAVATAALTGFGLGYAGAAAVEWVWDATHTPEEGGATYPATSGNCALYNMGVPGVPIAGNPTVQMRVFCTGALATATKLEINTTGGGGVYLVRVGVAPNQYYAGDEPLNYPGSTPTKFNVGYSWSGVGGYQRRDDLSFVGGISMSGVTINWATITPPEHKLRTEVTCAGGSIVTGYSVPYTEAGVAPNVPMPSCGPGVLPQSLTVRQGDANGAGGTQGFNWSAPAPAGATDPLKDCYPGGSAAPCTVALLKVVGSGLQACTDAAVDCTGFDAATSTPEQYQCRWGSHIVTLSACEALQPLQTTPGAPDPLEVGGSQVGTTTVTNPDGSTTTTEIQQMPDGRLRKVVTHNVNGTRTITTTEIDVNGNPVGQPSVVTVAPGEPVPIGSGLPLPGFIGLPETTTDCFPSGSALWNPVDWVMMPVQCALAWAFVPSAVNTAPIEATLDRVGVAPTVTALSDAVADLGGASGGCAGPSISFDIAPVHQVVQPFNACSEPMSTVAGYAYAFASVTVVIYGGYTVIGLIASAFGYSAKVGSSSDLDKS